MPSQNHRLVSSVPASPLSDEGIDFRHYFKVFYARKGLLLCCIIVFLVLGGFQLRRSTPIYTATARLKFEPRSQDLVNFGSAALTNLNQRDEIRTAVELIRSPALAGMVLDQMSVDPAPEKVEESPLAAIRSYINQLIAKVRSSLVTFKPPVIDPVDARRQRAIGAILNSVVVKQKLDTKLIDIEVNHRNAERAAEIANKYCDAFIQRLNLDKSSAFGTASEFLDQKVGEAEAAVGDAADQLFRYSVQSDLRVMEETKDISLKTMTGQTEDIETAKNEIAILEAENRASQSDEIRETLLVDDAYYKSLINKRSELLVERVALAAENQPRFPALARVDRELKGIEEQIKAATENVIRQSDGRLRVARLKLEGLQQRLEEQKTTVQGLQEKMIEYRKYERLLISAQAIYQNLLINKKGSTSRMISSRATSRSWTEQSPRSFGAPRTSLPPWPFSASWVSCSGRESFCS